MVNPASNLQTGYDRESIKGVDTRIRATLPIGLASYSDHAQTPDALIEQADAALYRAKRSGRNRTEIASAAAFGAITKG